MVRSLLLVFRPRPLCLQPMAWRDSHARAAGRGVVAAVCGSMAAERGTARVTCTAPVNIAVIKYCECGRGVRGRDVPCRVLLC